jgi:hypothetical protein
MKKFSINCDYGGQMAPFDIFIGQPEGSHHPLHFQAKWLSDNKGGVIPQEVMDAILKLDELAKKNGVLLEDLCVYALGSAQVESDPNVNDTTTPEDSVENIEDESSNVYDETLQEEDEAHIDAENTETEYVEENNEDENLIESTEEQTDNESVDPLNNETSEDDNKNTN